MAAKTAGTGEKPKTLRGPKPDLLKIKGRWQDAVKHSLHKKKPAEGWPK